MSASNDLLPEPVLAFLRRAGLVRPDETPPAAALSGGVSSDIWKVELRSGPVCVKRALPRLRVAQRWEAAPVERNRYEWRWMQAASRIVPGAAPRVLANISRDRLELCIAARVPMFGVRLHRLPAR